MLAVLLSPGLALAHASSNSYLTLTPLPTGVSEQRIDGSLRVAVRDLDIVLGLDENADHQVTDAEILGQASEISAYLLARLELKAANAVCEATPLPQRIDGEYLVLPFFADCPTRQGGLTVRYDLLLDHDPTHQGLLRLIEGDKTRTAVFTIRDSIKRFDLTSYTWWRPLVEFPVQGIWHIWSGWDHILFLLTLLLPSVVRRERGAWVPVKRFRPALRRVIGIVTAFTVAHSLTLALAVLNVVQLPPRLVESAIAVSVVVAALNNLLAFATRRSWLIAFLFGLVHGFGFAGVLADLGLDRDNLAVALFGFNLGVEIGQLVVVAAFVPLVFALRKTVWYPQVALRGGSLVVIAVASVWIVERAADMPLGRVVAYALHPTADNDARRALDQGKAQLASGQVRQAQAAFEQALAAYQAIGDQKAAAWIRKRLGDVGLVKAEIAYAVEMYRAALAAARAGGDLALQASVYRDLARAAQLSGKTIDASRQLRRALAVHEQLGQQAAIAEDLVGLGNIYRKLARWEEAVASYERALAIYQEARNEPGLAEAYAKLGIALQLKPDLDQAAAAYYEALVLDEALGRKLALANDHANLGNLERSRGRLNTARDHYEQSMRLFQSLGNKTRAAEVRKLLDRVRQRAMEDRGETTMTEAVP